jgi:phenylalanyl-tRNA synthetase beta chain
MKFSESWLRTLVDPRLTSEELAHLLTMAGLEVEELDPVAPQFDDVVVARVLDVTRHPDADRLNVCQVDTGRGAPTTIVCGAPNVAVGLRVPCALPGARLPGNFAIKVARGAGGRVVGNALLGQGTGDCRRRLGPAGSAGRCAGRAVDPPGISTSTTGCLR